MQHLKRGVPEVDLPDSLSWVRATVYASNTPVHICRAVAGRHQATQHDVREATVAESLNFIGMMAQEKDKKAGTVMFTDDELFKMLDNMGLIRGSEKSLQKGEEMNMKDATTISRQQV